jgi:catalase (peroxidase I)
MLSSAMTLLDMDIERRPPASEHLYQGRDRNQRESTWSGTAVDPIFGSHMAMNSPHSTSAITVDRERDREVKGLQRSAAMSVREE